MGKTEGTKEPEKVYVLKEESKGYRPTIKKVGRDPKLKGGEGTIFISPIKSYIVFKPDGGLIQFANQIYQTSDAEDIKFLKENDMFETDYWEGSLPEYILKKMESDRQFITRSEESFAAPEA